MLSVASVVTSMGRTDAVAPPGHAHERRWLEAEAGTLSACLDSKISGGFYHTCSILDTGELKAALKKLHDAASKNVEKAVTARAMAAFYRKRASEAQTARDHTLKFEQSAKALDALQKGRPLSARLGSWLHGKSIVQVLKSWDSSGDGSLDIKEVRCPPKAHVPSVRLPVACTFMSM